MIPGLVITLIVIVLLVLVLIMYEEFARLCLPAESNLKVQTDNPPSYEEATKSEV